MRKSLTLLELVVVVILIGLIASTAVAFYPEVVKHAMKSKVHHALSILNEAEKIYHSENGSYMNVSTATQFNTLSNASGINLSSIANDPEWRYLVSGIWAFGIKRNNPDRNKYRYVNLNTDIFGGTY